MDMKTKTSEQRKQASVNLKDEIYRVIEHPQMVIFDRNCEVELRRDIRPHCPRCGLKYVNKTSQTTFERWDIIDKMPTKVKLHVQKWKCMNAKCKHRFVDPRSPYHGERQTTDAFEKYVAESLFQSKNLSQSFLAERFDISEAKISGIVTRYIKNSKHKLPPAVPCETLWFMPFKYQKKWRLLILGRPDRQLGNFFGNPLWYRVAFLGISDEDSFEAALKSSNIAEPEKIQRIYCPGILRFEEAAEHLISKYNLKVFALSKHDPIMGWAIKMYAVLKDFQTRGFSLAQAAYMMRYKCHAYRTPIIDMSNKMSNNFFSPKNDGKYATSFKYWDLLGKRCYYVDTETLLHYYGKQDFYGKQ